MIFISIIYEKNKMATTYLEWFVMPLGNMTPRKKTAAVHLRQPFLLCFILVAVTAAMAAVSAALYGFSAFFTLCDTSDSQRHKRQYNASCYDRAHIFPP